MGGYFIVLGKVALTGGFTITRQCAECRYLHSMYYHNTVLSREAAKTGTIM